MIVYMKVVPETGLRILWTELKPGARSVNQRNMPMLRSEWWRFSRMLRANQRQEQAGKAIYLTQWAPGPQPEPESAIRNLLPPSQR
jgi:hypothetical protein